MVNSAPRMMCVATKSSKGFTLIELLTIVAIIAIMVTVAVVGVNAGQQAARLRGATRDVFATIRQARSIALVTQQSTVITYSTEREEDEVVSRVVLDSVRLMSETAQTTAQTLSGETVRLDAASGEEAPEEESTLADGAGESVEDILFAPIDEDLLRGIAIDVVMGEELETSAELRQLSSSAFSNADVILGRYTKPATNTVDSASSPNNSLSSDLQAPVSIAWEPNGRCEPHEMWIYPAGADREKGLCIKVDRFGAAKVVSEEDD